MSDLKEKLRVPVRIALGLLLGFILICVFNGVRHEFIENICKKRAKSVNALLEESGGYAGLKAICLRQTTRTFIGPLRIPIRDYHVYIYGDAESGKQRDAAISLIRENFDYANLLFQIDINKTDDSS